MKKLLLALALAVPAIAGAQERVYTVPSTQPLLAPDGSDIWGEPGDIAIDGDSLIVIQDGALLYRRDANGKWNYSRKLVAGTTARPYSVAMKNYIAIIKMGPTATIWEKVNGEWRQSPTAAPITAPGDFAISTNRIMAGDDGCTADALIYQKDPATGIWDVTGRIPPEEGICQANAQRHIDFNYDAALVRGYDDVLRTYRRNGSALVWPNAGNIALNNDNANPYWSPAIQSGTLVLGDQTYWRRTGGVWTKLGKLLPRDYFRGSGTGGNPIYRDGLLMTTDGVDAYLAPEVPYVYAKNAQGGFDHLGVLGGSITGPSTVDYAFAGNTAAVVTIFERGAIWYYIDVYTLPVTFRKPRAIANNFDARDVSGFQTSGGLQYAIAGNQYNYIYRQSNVTADTSAILEDSDWTDYQSVEADLKANAFNRADAWVGLAARYADANNYYYVTFGNDDVIRLNRKRNGVVTTLAQTNHAVDPLVWYHVRLTADQTGVHVSLGSSSLLTSTDTTLRHGRAGLMTSAARADFDNFLARPTGSFTVFDEEYHNSHGEYAYDGGHWSHISEGTIAQDDSSGQALAIHGQPMNDQSVEAYLKVGSFATTNPVAWVGVVARYVDANNFYYLSLRSSNQLQIRKMVDGAITVLKAVNYTVVPGQTYRLQLTVIGNELTATVQYPSDSTGAVVTARAVDDDLASGKFGVGTYRATGEFYPREFQP